jgi:hypothetical protein
MRLWRGPSFDALRKDATGAPQLKSAIDSVIKSIALFVALWPMAMDSAARCYGFNTKTATGVPAGFTEPVTFAPRTDTVVTRLSYKFNWGMPR